MKFRGKVYFQKKREKLFRDQGQCYFDNIHICQSYNCSEACVRFQSKENRGVF